MLHAHWVDTYGDDGKLGDGLANATGIVQHIPDPDVLQVLELEVVGPGRELSADPVSCLWVESVDDDVAEGERLDEGQIVGQALKVEAGYQLVVHVIEEFSLALLGDAVLLLPPEGEVHVPVAVVRVEAQVLAQVRHALLWISDGSWNTTAQKIQDHGWS